MKNISFGFGDFGKNMEEMMKNFTGGMFSEEGMFSNNAKYAYKTK